MRFNPYRPNSIASVGMFAGRSDELFAIDQALYQIKMGNPQHLLIHGERGIGKSSLLNVAKRVAVGEWEPLEDGQPNFCFLPVSICIEPSTTYAGLSQKIASELRRALQALNPTQAGLDAAWDFLKRWEVLGVRLHEANPGTSEDPIEDLARDLATTCKTLGDESDGILIMIDEADQGAQSCQLGEFVKILTERLPSVGCENIGLVVCGISSVLAAMRESHESSVRVFHSLRLDPLSPAERIDVLRLGIQHANEKNAQATALQADAAEWISLASEGYPHFIQQYAFSAFETDVDDNIDLNDVRIGAHKEHGAIDQLGTRYFEDMYIDRINSDDYRKVLQVMAFKTDGDGEYLSRATIKKRSGLKDTTLTNALGSLTKRDIIVKHREKQGLYKLPNTSFGTWIRARMQKASALGEER